MHADNVPHPLAGTGPRVRPTGRLILLLDKFCGFTPSVVLTLSSCSFMSLKYKIHVLGRSLTICATWNSQATLVCLNILRDMTQLSVVVE